MQFIHRLAKKVIVNTKLCFIMINRQAMNNTVNSCLLPCSVDSLTVIAKRNVGVMKGDKGWYSYFEPKLNAYIQMHLIE